MDDVVVLGVGMTRFTKAPERSIEDLGREAIQSALADSGVDRRSVGAAYVGTVESHPGVGQRLLKDVGLLGIPVVNVENACASGTTALREAYAAVRAGLTDVALAVGVESLSTAYEGVLAPDLDDYVWRSGIVLPAVYGLLAERHMHDYGTTPGQFARVAVKSHQNAMANPFAHFHKPVTVEAVLGAPVVADPITLYECCPVTDGAAAAVVVSGEMARRHTSKPIRIAASALQSGRPNRADGMQDLAERTAKLAYEAAGIGPGDVDVAEVHDAFAPGEIFAYEELGFCPHGEGGAYIDEGRSAIGGDGVAVNPSGGLLSRGHPLGATGLGQIAELVWQLRGRADGRQVEEAKVALCHTMGGTLFELEANACAVHVLVK